MYFFNKYWSKNSEKLLYINRIYENIIIFGSGVWYILIKSNC